MPSQTATASLPACQLTSRICDKTEVLSTESGKVDKASLQSWYNYLDEGNRHRHTKMRLIWILIAK